jgi:hypothetical protein
MHRVDHQLQRRIDYRARLLGVEVLHQLHRALDVGEQSGDGLALTVGNGSACRPGGNTNFGRRGRAWELIATCCRAAVGSQHCATVTAELVALRVLDAALWAGVAELRAAISAELLSDRIFRPAV